jgi:hypothetical protein
VPPKLEIEETVTFISALKELWKRRRLVALTVVLAAAAATVAVCHVSLAPPSLAKKSTAEAHGSSEILVDSARSPIAGSRRRLEGLVTRAGVFSRLMAGGDVLDRIATKTGIPSAKIGVVGPEPLPGEAPGITEAAETLPYSLAFIQEPELPIVSITTRAPTVAEARALAVAAPRALQELVKTVQTAQDTPAGERIEVRVLGPAQARMIEEGPGIKIGAVIFLALLILGLILILAIPRLISAWRESDVDSPDLGGLPDISEVTTRWRLNDSADESAQRLEPNRRLRERQGS